MKEKITNKRGRDLKKSEEIREGDFANPFEKRKTNV